MVKASSLTAANTRTDSGNTNNKTLVPFTHNKVGGHVPMFRLPYHDAICKSVTDTKERTFYENIIHHHPEFIPFIPHYMGSFILGTTSSSNNRSHYDFIGDDLSKLNNDEKVGEYIILEDLTVNKRKPCMMDIKMGTRQHGVYASLSKIKSQSLKCDNSTSRQLGVRVCGMQVIFCLHLDNTPISQRFYNNNPLKPYVSFL